MGVGRTGQTGHSALAAVGEACLSHSDTVLTHCELPLLFFVKHAA